MTHEDVAALLRGWYQTAIDAADPARAVRDGVRAHEVTLGLHRDRPHWIIALGKAAPAMAAAAVAHCEVTGRRIGGGLVVGAGESLPPHPAIAALAGDHPVPGARSARAAEALGTLVSRVARGDVVLVLVSGGTSSLIGAPVPGVRAEDLAALHALLLGAGVPISRTNAVRKRFSRWGAGRLAEALQGAHVLPILLADVPNEDPAMIGSGPVSPDPLDARLVERLLREAGIAMQVPLSVAAALRATRAGLLPETPKPGQPAFAQVAEPFVVGNAVALDAVAAAATEAGFGPVLLSRTPLQGDATAAGRVIAHAIARAPTGAVLAWGGETTVRLPPDHGLGGRCQQLALAAAEVLVELDVPTAWILAAGTDGRDGPAPAAGAIVSASSWRASADGGGAPRPSLRRCDAFAALDAAGAILPARATGTNVMDIVVAVRA